MMSRTAWRVERGVDGEPLSRLHVSEPVFAYAKVPAADIAEVWQLAGAGFRVVDTALSFDGRITGVAVDGIRFATPEDRESVAHIAATAFRYSRFHLDPFVPKAVADVIKSTWAMNYFEGKRGDGMVVAERDGRVVGFLQLLWASPDQLVIDLIGVEPSYQGQGVGRRMIVHAALCGTGDGRVPTVMSVGTQAANRPSVRLYESLGFRLNAAQYVMHSHGTVKTAQP
jgi:ribosomal protein S18 acetylase RimI-like enzyme